MPKDKILHIGAGFLAGAAVTVLMFYLGADRASSAIAGALFAAVLGVGKEMFDYLHPSLHTADALDAAATAVGGVLGALIAFGVMK